MSHHTQEASIIITKKELTKVFKDNSACVVQLKVIYIKNDRTKHNPIIHSRAREKSKFGHRVYTVMR